MRMNMSDFATFFAVARNQSFRAAGDELGLSSSAIILILKSSSQLTTLLSISSNRALTLAFDLVASSKKI